jgi:hypothetical protein
MANSSYIGTGPPDRDPTVSDDSVSTAKIQDDAVTNAKIDNNAVDGAQIALTGNVQGAVMYYNGTDWVVLTPGTSGEALKTQGAGQNVVWGAVSSTGDFANGGDTATANRTLGNNDNFAMGFETNAVNWFNINTDGIPQITGGLQANFDTAGVASTLSSGIDASVTTIPITSSTGFPATGTVGVGTEEITYTGVAGNTLTGATRGANSTTAAAHLSSAAIGTVFSTPSNYNALSAGPVGIAVGSTITLGTDSTWTVV